MEIFGRLPSEGDETAQETSRESTENLAALLSLQLSGDPLSETIAALVEYGGLLDEQLQQVKALL